MLILACAFPIAVTLGGIAPLVMLGITLLLLLGLIYYHKEVNAYICPRCHHKFSISFFRDMFSLNGIHKGKYLRCPHCGRWGWLRETFPE